jgi:hypothetical protein
MRTGKLAPTFGILERIDEVAEGAAHQRPPGVPARARSRSAGIRHPEPGSAGAPPTKRTACRGRSTLDRRRHAPGRGRAP